MSSGSCLGLPNWLFSLLGFLDGWLLFHVSSVWFRSHCCNIQNVRTPIGVKGKLSFIDSPPSQKFQKQPSVLVSPHFLGFMWNSDSWLSFLPVLWKSVISSTLTELNTRPPSGFTTGLSKASPLTCCPQHLTPGLQPHWLCHYQLQKNRTLSQDSAKFQRKPKISRRGTSGLRSCLMVSGRHVGWKWEVEGKRGRQEEANSRIHINSYRYHVRSEFTSIHIDITSGQNSHQFISISRQIRIHINSYRYHVRIHINSRILSSDGL